MAMESQSFVVQAKDVHAPVLESAILVDEGS